MSDGDWLELPKGWQWKRLDEVTNIRSGQAVPSSTYTDDGEGGTPFLQGNAEFGELFPTPVKRTLKPKVMTDEHAVLISVRAPVGATNFSPGEVCIGRGLAAVTPGAALDQHYLLWALRGSRPELERQATGTTFPAVTSDVLGAHSIPVPPLDDQRRIARNIAEGFMRMGSGEEDLMCGFDRLDLFLRSSIARVVGRSSPPLVRLDAVGGIYVGATPRRSEPSFWGGDVPWVSSGEVAFNRIASTKETITEAGLGDRTKRLQPAGSVLIAMYGEGKTRGQAAILDIDAATNQAVASVRVDGRRALPEFVFFCLMQLYGTIREAGSGTQQKNLSKGLVQAIEIPLPSLEQQRAAVSEIAVVAARTQALRQGLLRQRDATRGLRKAVLNSALSGQL